MNNFSFKIMHEDKNSDARIGVIKTKHGNIKTPYLIPVATRAKIIAITKKDIKYINPQALLANAYHLHFMSPFPKDEEIKKAGGLHKIMQFNKPIFTDSGGFQALSLGQGRKSQMRKIGFFAGKNKIQENKSEKSFVIIKKEGVLFKSAYDKKIAELITAKSSMQIQSNLQSDIIIAFDQCNFIEETKKQTEEITNRSHQWELESLEYRNPRQAIYGIIHGGVYKDLRVKSAKFIANLPFDGIAIGGSMGKTKKEMYKIISWIMPYLKKVENKPRHLLGIGHVDDIFEAVEKGIDTFDCVETSRIARHGSLYVSPYSGGNKKNKFRIDIGKAIYKNDKKPIDKKCKCKICKKYSRAELHKLFKSKDKRYANFATLHNLFFMENLTKEIRKSIKENSFKKLKKYWLK